MARQRDYTNEFIATEFYRRFHRMTGPERRGVLRGLTVIADAEDERQQPTLPFTTTEMSAGEIEERELISEAASAREARV
jgi:hypothetical protein